MTDAKATVSFHPGGDELPSGVVRRRKAPETDLTRKAIRP